MSDQQNLELIDLGPVAVHTLDGMSIIASTSQTISVKCIVDVQQIQLDYKANNKGEFDLFGSNHVTAYHNYYKPLCFIIEGSKDSPVPLVLSLVEIEDNLQKINHPTPIYFSEAIDHAMGDGSDFITPKPRTRGREFVPFTGQVNSEKPVGLSLKPGQRDDTTCVSAKDYKQNFIRHLRDIKTHERTQELDLQKVLDFNNKNYNASKLAIGCYGGSFLAPESITVPVFYVAP